MIVSALRRILETDHEVISANDGRQALDHFIRGNISMSYSLT